MPYFKDSELILNQDGSIYHLNLLPEDIATTIISVGDPDRVSLITRHFDQVFLSKQKREFKTETGSYRGKIISVISTGIGTDNIDIVLNELDALVNIDFKSRRVKEKLTNLDIIRLGTSGALQENIPVDSMLVSKLAIGFDNLMHYYKSEDYQDVDLQKAFTAYMQWGSEMGKPYVVQASPRLLQHFKHPEFITGFTATNVGFYAPQGRQLRGEIRHGFSIEKIKEFEFDKQRITNMEMETSAIYGLSKILGHHALSINAILANRSLGQFSLDPQQTVSRMIQIALDRIISL